MAQTKDLRTVVGSRNSVHSRRTEKTRYEVATTNHHQQLHGNSEQGAQRMPSFFPRSAIVVGLSAIVVGMSAILVGLSAILVGLSTIVVELSAVSEEHPDERSRYRHCRSV